MMEGLASIIRRLLRLVTGRDEAFVDLEDVRLSQGRPPGRTRPVARKRNGRSAPWIERPRTGLTAGPTPG